MNNGMKALFGAVLVVLFSMFSVSCSKQNDKNIVGKWQSTMINYQSYEGENLVEQSTENCINWYIGFNFKSDGTGQYIEYDSEYGSSTSQITWVIMDDKLMVTSESEQTTATFDIHSITGSQMVLSVTEEYSYDGLRAKDITTFTFKKI